jgi:hypothetical protein
MLGGLAVCAEAGCAEAGCAEAGCAEADCADCQSRSIVLKTVCNGDIGVSPGRDFPRSDPACIANLLRRRAKKSIDHSDVSVIEIVTALTSSSIRPVFGALHTAVASALQKFTAS